MNIFLDTLFPKRCVGCGKIGSYLCVHCSLLVRSIELHEMICPVCEKSAIDGLTHPRCRGRYTIDGLTSFFHYEKVIQKAIKAMKYRYVRDVAKELVGHVPQTSYNFIVQCHEDMSSNNRLFHNHQSLTLIPIPLHTFRLRNRGFNQSEVLGSFISELLHIPMRTDVLERVYQTIPQVEMKNRKERLTNIKHVFSINKRLVQTPASLAKRFDSIILFDDVFTTGATMRAAANVLKHYGTKFVWGVTMAR